jgi:hypothetical protein
MIDIPVDFAYHLFSIRIDRSHDFIPDTLRYKCLVNDDISQLIAYISLTPYNANVY